MQALSTVVLCGALLSGCASTFCVNGLCETIKDGKATYEGPTDRVAEIQAQQTADQAWREQFDRWRSSAPARPANGRIRVLLAGVTASGGTTYGYSDEYWAWASEELRRQGDFDLVPLTPRDVSLAHAGNDLLTPSRVQRMERGAMPNSRPPLSDAILDFVRLYNRADLVLHMEVRDDAIIGASAKAGIGTATIAAWSLFVTDPWTDARPQKVAEGTGRFQFTISGTKQTIDKNKIDARMKKAGIDVGLWAKAREADGPAFSRMVSQGTQGVRDAFGRGGPSAAAVTEWIAANPRPKHHAVPEQAPSLQDVLRQSMQGGVQAPAGSTQK